jgi:hypothetical protein
MRPYPYMILSAFACMFVYMAGVAQPALLTNSTADGDLLIQSSTREQEPLYRGAEYWWYPFPLSNGIAYFESDSLIPGEVVYYGRQYKNVPLIYDQVSDELVTVGMSGHVLLRLFGPAVHSFSIHNSSFIYLKDTATMEKQGFWQIVIDDRTALLKRELKVIKTRIINSQIAYVIQPQIFYRIRKDGKYQDVNNREAMLQVFADKTEDVTAFLRKNKRKFRKAGFEETLKQTASFYNQITVQR